MTSTLAIILMILMIASLCQDECAATTQIQKYAVFETAFESDRDYGNPFRDASLNVKFKSPSGKESTVEAFWDGGRTWRARFSPDRVGQWSWRTKCSDAANTGLNGQRGGFTCTAYKGSNPVYRRGVVKLSSDRRYFVCADGKPFFWLADTAWNGVLRARPADWDKYLTARREQGFTAIQFICTQWRGLAKDAKGETAYTEGDGFRINPSFFQRMDGKVAAINEHGLVASPVMLWATGQFSPGVSLPEEDAIKLGRYIAARWGAYNVVWILNGDGGYVGENAERWQHIGRGIFGDRHDRLVTMHPGGPNWCADEFREEKWYDFIGYQSGHGDSEDSLWWQVIGPPAQGWLKSPPCPIVDLEPNYEAIQTYHSRTVIEADRVRRALYWSLLVAPTAGVTYGHNGIWPWGEKPEVPLNHSGIAPSWHESVHTEGVVSVGHLKKLFGSIPWWRLRPAQELLAAQPGDKDPLRFVTVAKTDDGTLAMLYMPKGGEIGLRGKVLNRIGSARWFNPRAGVWKAAGIVKDADIRLSAPDDHDWVLILKADGKQ